MGKTQELYYESAYIKEFDATVLSCEKTQDGKYSFVLDRTAFFPEQGGQTSDVGVLLDGEGISHSVTYTSIKDGIISHICEDELKASDKVHGIIDWEHRFSNMQQHTGEHIFSGIVHNKYGFENVGFHLSDSEVTMDYSGVLADNDINEIESKVNRAIWENVDVICEFPDDEKLETIDYRSKKELSGDIRIVTVTGYDVCACCAPHVAKTGEIGFLKVIGAQNYKGGVRVSILCGKRALEYVSAEHTIVSSLVGIYTTSNDNIIASVNRQMEELAALKAELAAARDELISYEIDAFDSEMENVFLKKPASVDANTIRKTVNALAERHRGFSGIFAGDDQNGYKFVIASGTDGRDVRAAMELLKNKFGARGGGNSKMIQGSIKEADIDDVIEAIQNTERPE